MALKRVSVVIIAEDQRSGEFLRSYAARAFAACTVRVDHAPSGSGSGEAWVRNRFATEVRELRRGLRRAVLIVHVDADSGTVEQELGHLERALHDAGLDRRGRNEPIALVVPKRNTETWLHALCGAAADERYNFKEDKDRVVAAHARERDNVFDRNKKTAAGALYALTRPNAPAPPPGLPALARAIEELRRLES